MKSARLHAGAQQGRWWHGRDHRLWRLAAVLVLAACSSGDSEPFRAGALDAPASVRQQASACVNPSGGGLIAHEWAADAEGGRHCVRAFTGLRRSSLSAVREAPQAVPSRIISINELFNWAERTYPQFFPSARSNNVLGPYTYRYYPESQNHAAVAGDEIFVQGPISGGSLLRVGTLAEFTCQVDPTLCGQPARDCSAPASWNVDGNVCVPDPGQPSTIANGNLLGLFDFTGTVTGVANFRCTDGALAIVGTPSCRFVPRSCDTTNLSWTVGGQTCNRSTNDPTTLASGASFEFTDASGTTGRAVFQCSDGSLATVGVASCSPPQAACPTVPREWKVNDSVCSADVASAGLPAGASALLRDTTDPVTGSITYFCDNGQLQISGTPSCSGPRMEDSFGGDGGAADGSANGDGTAGDGAPIVGGTVWAVDVTGRTVFAASPTDSQGYFRLKLTGMVPPLVLNVRRSDGVVRRSVSTQPLKTNGYIFIAITGLTDWIAADVSQQVSGTRSAAALTPQMIAQQPSAVPAAVNALKNNAFVNAELVAAGINVTTFDPLSTPFRPNGTGHDRVLDNLIITTDASGATVIGPTYCFTPASWTVGGNTCVPNAGTPSTIPSLTTLIVGDSVGPLRGTVGFTCIRGVLQAPVLPNCS